MKIVSMGFLTMLKTAVSSPKIRMAVIVSVAAGAVLGGSLLFRSRRGTASALASEETNGNVATSSQPETHGAGVKPAGSTRLVETTVVTRSHGYAPLRYPATVAASRKVQMPFRVGGPLVEVAIRPGSRVKKGDVLMRIDPRDFENQVEATESELAAAKAKYAAMENGARPEDIEALKARIKAAEAVRDYVKQQYGRMERLVEKRAVARAQFDSTESRLTGALAELEALHEEMAKAKAGARVEDIQAMRAQIAGLETKLRIAQDALSDTVLKAPFDGIVTKQYLENHEMAESGHAAVAMHDISKLEIETSLPEKEVVRRDIGTTFPAEVRFHAAPEKHYRAVFKEIDTDANPQTRTYDVVFVMDAPEDVSILPGMTAEVRVPACSSENQILSVPASAVVTDTQGRDFVWAMRDDGTAERRRVGKGRLLQGNRYEITEGLAEGDEVVTAGAKFVYHGKRVSRM